MARSKQNDPRPVDVLAAEEFGVPAPDPALRPEHLVLPPDPVADEPHDVLAAEAFAMPSPDEAHRVASASRHNQAALRVALNVVPLLAVWLLRRARRDKAAEVSCGSRSVCTAVGQSGDNGSEALPLVEDTTRAS